MNTYQIQTILEQYPLVTYQGLLLAHHLDNINIPQVIEQYSVFSSSAIHLLLLARIACYQSPELATVLDQNIQEELGSKTDGIPHLEIMRQGYLSDLDIDTTRVLPMSHTQELILNLRRVMVSDDIHYLSGGVTAFEAIAHDEFKYVWRLVQKEYPSLSPSSKTAQYLCGHFLFEQDHERELVQVCDKLGYTQTLEFYQGYARVCELLHEWWSSTL